MDLAWGPDAELAPAGSRPWARIVGHSGEFVGELVGFSHRIAVVAFDTAPPLGAGRRVRVQLGVGEEQAETVSGAVLHTLAHTDGRPAVAVQLPDDASARRRGATRVPFSARIDAMVVQGPANGEARIRGVAVDLSVDGLAMHTDRQISLNSIVLLRFPIPPHRGTVMQIRATVTECRPDGDDRYRCGLTFERISPGQLPQLQTAVVALRKKLQT